MRTALTRNMFDTDNAATMVMTIMMTFHMDAIVVVASIVGIIVLDQTNEITEKDGAGSRFRAAQFWKLKTVLVCRCNGMNE
jgi:uncharacterized membrane protein